MLRTRDINIAAAVGRASESRKLRIYNEPAVNTLSDEFANRVENETDFQLIKEQEVVTISLEEILNKHLPDGQGIEFLSVDVEGMDLEVLQSNNWNRYRPAMVLSEYHGENLEASTIAEACKSPINSFMCTKGYAMVAKTARTMFFQRKN